MPFQNQVHINRPLTEFSLAYMQDQSNFIADKIFPKIQVKHQSDTYFIYNRGDFNRSEVVPRAPGTEAVKANFDIKSSDPYHCLNYALREEIPYEILQNQDDPLDIELDASKFLMNKFLINKELIFAKQFFSPGIWGTEYQGVAKKEQAVNGNFVLWSDYKDSNPLKDIRNAMTKMQLNSGGFRPNTLLITRAVYDCLVDHPRFLDRVLYKPVGSEATIESAALARLFGLKNIYIMDSIVNTAPEGKDETNTFICGNHALLCYIAEAPALRSPSAGYCFTWNGVYAANGGRGNLGSGSGELAVISYWYQPRKVTIVEAETSFDLKIIGKDLGVFFTGCI